MSPLSSVMWRYFRFLHMTDVGNSEITLHVEKFQINSEQRCFFAIYAFLSRLCFVAIYALLRGEKLAPNLICGEKITNIRYVEMRRDPQIVPFQVL